MNSWLVDPPYFAAWAAAAGATASDPDLSKGTHLRLFPSATLGFPLAPFLLWKVDAFSTEPLPMTWFSGDARTLATPDLDAAGGELHGRRLAESPSDGRIVGIEARFHGGGGDIAVLDRTGERIVTARSSARWLVAAPQITHVRVRGNGPVTLQGWVISAGRAIEEILGNDPFGSLSAPIDGDRPWYAGGEGSAPALVRVDAGAPQRWTPPDRPDGPFDPLTPAAELARVAVFQSDLDDDFERLVGDPETPPSAVLRTHLWPAEVFANGKRRAWQEATEQVQGSLLMKALDPGAGRYLGLAAPIRDLLETPDPFQSPGVRGWLATGLFAVGPELRFELPDADPMEQRLIERLIELQPGVRGPLDLAVGRHGLTVRGFVATALAAPPPDLPSAPNLRLGDAGWQREDEGPSTRFRQQLRVSAPTLATLLALGRLEPAGWTSRHDAIDLTSITPDADPRKRAATRMLGSTASLTDGPFGIIADKDIPSVGAPWTYRVALSDVFGRFGDPADIAVSTPPRPPVPKPALRAHPTLSERAAGNAPSVVGTLRLTLVVPALQEMTAGSRPLARAVVILDGARQDAVTPQAGGTLAFDYALPALLPLEARSLVATAHFEDTEGNPGSTATMQVDVRDPRSPPIPRTGIGIVWSSRPSPAMEVEFRLHFTGVAGARYRVYLADSRGLDIALLDGDRPRTRAEIALEGARSGLAGAGLRERFRLLTEKPLQPAGDGGVRFDTRLPRALETVQFLRFVPLSDAGSEAPFESCPLLPIAVPDDRRPPAPQVEIRVDPDTAVAHVTVRAVGFDLVALRAAEPGLFDEPPAAGTPPPEYRLRRASGGVPDAVYAREIARGALQRSGEDFMATRDDAPTPGGLIAYVHYHYWAEVRLPPERRLPPGVTEVPLPAGAIEPMQATQRQDAPGTFSLVSAPAMAMFVPADVPSLVNADVTATIGAGAVAGNWRVSLAIAGGPVVNARAEGTFRVRLHLKADAGDWLPESGDTPLVNGSRNWVIERSSAALPELRIALVLIDPIGREADPLILDAVAA